MQREGCGANIIINPISRSSLTIRNWTLLLNIYFDLNNFFFSISLVNVIIFIFLDLSRRL